MQEENKFFKGFIVGLLVALASAAILIVFMRDYLFNAAPGDKSGVTSTQSDEKKYNMFIGKLNNMLTVIKKDFYEDVDPEVLYEGALDGIMAALDDPYSCYYTAEEAAAVFQATSGSYVGIGCYVGQLKDTNDIVVVSVMEDSPAEKAGLKPEDILIGVDGTDITNLSLDYAMSLVKGPEGSEVVITVKRGDETLDLPMKIAKHRRNIGIVFQDFRLLPEMTVYENVAFAQRVIETPIKKIKRDVPNILSIMGLSERLDAYPSELSGGEQQRVALARALVNVFLMDEPLSNLDAKLRVQMRIEISKLHQRLETTIIYVTHDQTEAMTLGTRIVVMKDGVIQQVDTPQNLYDAPNNLFVAGFMGSPQMNFINSIVGREGNKVTLTFGSTTITIPEIKAKKLIDAGYEGKTVVLGIRPEDIKDEEMFISNSPESVVEVTVRVYELLGAEVFLYLDVDNYEITARVNPRTTARPGDQIRVAMDLSKLHIFDKETEQVITH